MHPPKQICREIYDLHKHLRLAWMGRPKAFPEELDPGDFVIVQLMHESNCGTYEKPRTIKEFWEVETYEKSPGIFAQRKVNRGILFNRDGGTSPDWDRLSRRPVIIASVTPAFGLSPHSLYDGTLREFVKRNLVPRKEMLRRRVDAARAKGRRIDERISDHCAEMTEYMWWEGNKADQTSPQIAKKHIDTRHRLEHFREGAYNFEKMYEKKLPDALLKEAAK